MPLKHHQKLKTKLFSEKGFGESESEILVQFLPFFCFSIFGCDLFDGVEKGKANNKKVGVFICVEDSAQASFGFQKRNLL